MAARQLHLFAPPKPLVRRLGAEFFHAAPRAPGVYIMTGADDRVLYVGQSKNLRARLASYKNAQPDRAPRKVIRLVRAVERITWETCESAEGARLRENELLRLYRPRFNRVNVWPRAYSYIRLRSGERELELGRTPLPQADGYHLYGAFKTGAAAGYGALLRLLWAGLHPEASFHDFPAQLLSAKPPREYRFRWQGTPTPPGADVLRCALGEFLAGTSGRLIDVLRETMPSGGEVSPFQQALFAGDLDTLGQFYCVGPRRNYDLSRRHRLPSSLIAQAELDDLMI